MALPPTPNHQPKPPVLFLLKKKESRKYNYITVYIYIFMICYSNSRKKVQNFQASKSRASTNLPTQRSPMTPRFDVYAKSPVPLKYCHANWSRDAFGIRLQPSLANSKQNPPNPTILPQTKLISPRIFAFH